MSMKNMLTPYGSWNDARQLLNLQRAREESITVIERRLESFLEQIKDEKNYANQLVSGIYRQDLLTLEEQWETMSKRIKDDLSRVDYLKGRITEVINSGRAPVEEPDVPGKCDVEGCDEEAAATLHKLPLDMSNPTSSVAKVCDKHWIEAEGWV